MNEFTDGIEMEVDTSINVIGGGVKNLIIHFVVDNNNEEGGYPVKARALEGLAIENGYIVESSIVVNPQDFAEGDLLALYSPSLDRHYFVVPELATVGDLENMRYFEADRELEIIDPTEYASANIIFWE